LLKGVFITGTDTGIGKTVVAAGILRHLRSEGLDIVPMKPIQTGATKDMGTEMQSTDLKFCLEAADLHPSDEELEWMAPYRYEPACSPHLAGKMAGSYPQVGRIKECAERLCERHAGIIVEGAGGVLVPINESTTMLDLMYALGLPVVIVARAGLGTINHTLLSINALRARRLDIAGVILNETEDVERDLIREDNPKAIAEFGQVPILAEIPYLEDVSKVPDIEVPAL